MNLNCVEAAAALNNLIALTDNAVSLQKSTPLQ